MNKFWLGLATLLIVGLMLSLQTPASAVVKKGNPCGGFGLPLEGGCSKGSFCQAPPGACAVLTPGGGTCTLPQQTCINLNQPVCGCDFKTYKNDCVRRQARVSKAKDGVC